MSTHYGWWSSARATRPSILEDFLKSHRHFFPGPAVPLDMLSRLTLQLRPGVGIVQQTVNPSRKIDRVSGRARSIGSRGFTRTPTLGETMSGIPPTRLATQGVPDAKASNKTIPKASSCEGKTNSLARFIHRAICACD